MVTSRLFSALLRVSSSHMSCFWTYCPCFRCLLHGARLKEDGPNVFVVSSRKVKERQEIVKDWAQEVCTCPKIPFCPCCPCVIADHVAAGRRADHWLRDDAQAVCWRRVQEEEQGPLCKRRRGLPLSCFLDFLVSRQVISQLVG